VQSTILASAPTIVDAFSNGFHKIKSFNNIDHDKIEMLESRVRAT
jgi:hypothetical protein